MLKSLGLLLLALATCGLHSSAEGLIVELRSGEESFAGTRVLIDNVIAQLQHAASDTAQAVTNFTTGIQAQVQEFREDLTADVNLVKATIKQTISNATIQIAGTATGVLECITESRRAAEASINEAVLNVTSCADSKLVEIVIHVAELINITKRAADAAEEVRASAAACGNSSANIFSIGKCLGGLLWQTNVKAATITGQSALLVARINLSLAALPSTLSMCAATRFTQAALGAGQLAQNLGKCSLTAVTSSQ